MANTGQRQTEAPLNCYSTSDKAGVCYSQNHMWIDIHENKSCHIGVDAFLATFLRNVDRLSFVTTRPVCQPTVVFSVRGIDLPLTFPEKIQVTGVNAYLRARPSTLTTHPYTLGWLFEGFRTEQSPKSSASSMGTGMIRNDQARRWLKRESNRMTDYVRGELMAGKNRDFATMTDGGVWSEDLITHLTRDETLRVWNEFFSVTASSPQPDD